MHSRTTFSTRTALFLALTLVLQALRLPAFLTGPLVNFMLALTALRIGTTAGIIIAMLTPWLALLFGILPPPLAPAIPFIMAGNVLFAASIGIIHHHHPGKAAAIAAAAAGSTAKFAIIAGAASYILALPAPVTGMLLFPQLYNALLGGMAAVFFSTTLPKS